MTFKKKKPEFVEKDYKLHEFEEPEPPYSAKPIKTIDYGEGTWNYLKIGIFHKDKQIGEYVRNYNSFFNTFCPFCINGKWYALYSENYTCTYVMELPSCKKIGGEDPHGHGFCPTDYFIPIKDDEKEDPEYSKHGFISGCVWGDDSSWKIQHLDLSKIGEGIIKRDSRFGYIEMPRNTKRLSDIIELDEWDSDKFHDTIEIGMSFRFKLNGELDYYKYDELKEYGLTKEQAREVTKIIIGG